MKNERFYEIVKEICELHDKKNHDYAADTDPLSNFKMVEAGGIEAWKGVGVRLTDKISRLLSFMKKGELKNEGIIDTFNDICVYAILGRILYEEWAIGISLNKGDESDRNKSNK